MATFRELYEEMYGTARTPPARGIPASPVDPRYDRRRGAIQALVTGGATEGERSAAQAAMDRLDAAAESHAGRMGRMDSEAESFGSYD